MIHTEKSNLPWCPKRNRLLVEWWWHTVHRWVKMLESTKYHVRPTCQQGRFYVGAWGTCPPDSLVVPLDSKASWPFWRDFWGPKMLKNPHFPGSAPDPLCELPRTPYASLHLQHSQTPNWWGGGSLPLPRTPPPLSALWESFLRVSGSNPLQSWQPY